MASLSTGAGDVASGEMDPDEAALAAELLGVRYAVASHYDDVDDDHVRRFLAAVPEHDTTGQRVPIALHPDETLVIDRESHRVEAAVRG